MNTTSRTNRKGVRAGCWVAWVTVIAIPTVGYPSSLHAADPLAESLPSVYGFINTHSTFADYPKALKRWQLAPAYAKLSAADSFVKGLTNIESTDFPDYRLDGKSHDLRCFGGRAAHALETLFPMKLSPVTAKSTNADLQAIQKTATEFLAGYRAGLLAAAAEYAVGKSVADLKKRYRGTISTANSDDYLRQCARLEQLLQEWFPLGKRASDLEEITGIRVDRFRFEDDSWGFGKGYQFKVDAEGRITAVLSFPLY